jgi:ribosomal protein S12 methylthiotransferase accessory factor
MIQRLQMDSKLIISRVKSAIDVSTFWALLLNKSGMSALTMLNSGWGTHANPEIALSRAITEAAQSRLTYIHGAREDIIVQAGYHHKNAQDTKAFKYFSSLEPQTDWQDLDGIGEAPDSDLESAWDKLIRKLDAAGYHDIYRVDLTRPDLDIPVVKILVPGMTFNQKLY